MCILFPAVVSLHDARSVRSAGITITSSQATFLFPVFSQSWFCGKAIEWIQQEADGYDKGLKTLSDSLMQEKLKKVIPEAR